MAFFLHALCCGLAHRRLSDFSLNDPSPSDDLSSGHSVGLLYVFRLEHNIYYLSVVCHYCDGMSSVHEQTVADCGGSAEAVFCATDLNSKQISNGIVLFIDVGYFILIITFRRL
jgi:hypothetical protein